MAAGEHELASSECRIEQVGKSRNGANRFWCLEHGSNATGRYGARLERCERAYITFDESDCFTIDDNNYPGGIGVWGAVQPIYNTSNMGAPSGVHVHARKSLIDEDKDIDRTFSAIKVFYRRDLFEEKTAIITQESAINFFVSKHLNLNMTYLHCIKCGSIHLDADYFATHPHKKHLCNTCGHYFLDNQKSVSNPISFLRNMRGDTDDSRELITASDPLDVIQSEHPNGMQVWASNPAILWTVPRSEHSGLHVHIYSEHGDGRRIVDDTFNRLTIDGFEIKEEFARQLMAQKALPFIRNKVTSLKCPRCDSDHFDSGEWGFIPHKNHVCAHCKHQFVTPGRRRLVVSNPLEKLLEELQRKTLL